jgi:hypothetical protein
LPASSAATARRPWLGGWSEHDDEVDIRGAGDFAVFRREALRAELHGARALVRPATGGDDVDPAADPQPLDRAHGKR